MTDWAPRAWRVQVEDEDNGKWWHSIAAAIGPRDAMNQAKVDYPDATPLRAQPFLCEGCGHPANSHDPSVGRCSVPDCVCTAGYVAGRTPETLYPGEHRNPVIVDGEEVIGYVGFINPDGSGEGNWAEREWARLRADGFSESELRERSGAQ